jgi:hypothetical protein
MEAAANSVVSESVSGQMMYRETTGYSGVVRESGVGAGERTAISRDEKKLHRFYGSIQINERMMASEASKIMEEVVKHLTSLSGAKVTVTLEITADLPNGAPDHTVRTVKENSNTLRFQTSEFHEE